MPIKSFWFSVNYRDLLEQLVEGLSYKVQLPRAGEMTETGKNTPSSHPGVISHTRPSSGYLQFRGTSCGWTLSSLANLVLLLALLPSTIVRTFSHWKPPLRIRSYLGVIVLGQLSYRTVSARQWDWSQLTRRASTESTQSPETRNRFHCGSSIKVLFSLLCRNVPYKRCNHEHLSKVRPRLSKGLQLPGSSRLPIRRNNLASSLDLPEDGKHDLPFFFFFFFFTSPCLKRKAGNSHCDIAQSQTNAISRRRQTSPSF